MRDEAVNLPLPAGPGARGRMTPARWGVLGCLAGVAGGAAWIYHFPPVQSGMYPQCVFHRLTGLYCSGCGATRALHFLTHGQWLEALRSHGLLVVALPWMGILSLRMAWAAWHGNPLPGRLGRIQTWGIVVGVLVLFGIVRNLPLEICRGLIPQ